MLKLNQFFIFLSVFLIAHANVWDSLFTDKPSPFRSIPDNFEMQLSSDSALISSKIYLNYSSELNQISIRDETDLFITTSLMRAILDLDNGSIYIHSYLDSCMWAQNDIASSRVDLSKLKLIWDFASSYVNTTVDNLDVYNVSALSRIMRNKTDVYMYFDKQQQLKEIRIDTESGELLLNVDKLESRNFTRQDFEVPTSWKCREKDQITMDDLQSQDFMGSLLGKLMDLKPDSLPDLSNLGNLSYFPDFSNDNKTNRRMLFPHPNYNNYLAYYMI